MAKKGLLVLILAVIVAGGAFAQNSAGGGLVYTGDWTSKMSAKVGGKNYDIKYPWDGIGFYGFFNMKYLELSSGVHYTVIESKVSDPVINQFKGDVELAFLSLCVLGKYPFSLGEKIVIFPAAGLDLYICYNSDDGYVNSTIKNSDFTHLWFRFGGGIDFNLTEKLYLRGTVLFGIRTQMEYEDDFKDYVKKSGINPDVTPGFGAAVRVAIGVKFI